MNACFRVLVLAGLFSLSPQGLFAVVDTAGLSPQRIEDPVVLGPRGLHSLLATWAMRTTGIVERADDGYPNGYKPKHFWIHQWANPQDRLAWHVESPSQAEYRVTFLVDCAAGRKLRVTGPLNSVVYTASEAGWQRVTAPEPLRLPQGRSVIGVTLEYANEPAVRLKSLELLDVRDEADLSRRVAAFKGDAGWMKDAGYGIMVQAGGWSYPPHGEKKPWPGFAEDFDAAAFVQKVAEMGGKYLVWSATWSDFLFPAPIEAIREILPQRVSRRDLIRDLIAECRKRDLRFVLYYHFGHGQPEVMAAKGLPADFIETAASRKRWHAREIKILTEIGLRYGEGLDAVFMDDGISWYPADFEQLGAAIKAGNPKRLICYNPWVAPSLTPFQDFWCGEGFDGKETPYPLADGVVTEGPQRGLQLFGNFILDGPDWGVNKPETKVYPPKTWTTDRIVQLTQRLEKERYSVAINLLLFEDGSISPDSYNLLHEAAAKLGRTR